MAITRQKKEEILAELIEKFGRSQSVVFADYRGLDVAGVSGLRNKLREGGAEMKVAKKTLIGLAAKENKIDELAPSIMEGPVAATFSYEDPLAGIKILFNFAKENDKLKLLGGIIDGKPVGPDVIQKYAKLPGREELLAKLVGSMNAPVSGFVGVLGNLIGGFVRVLNAYKDTLPAEAAPPKAKEEVPGTPDSSGAEASGAEEVKASEEKAEEKPAEVSEEKAEAAEAPAAEEKPAETEEVKADQPVKEKTEESEAPAPEEKAEKTDDEKPEEEKEAA